MSKVTAAPGPTIEEQIEAIETEIRVLTACDLIDPKHETPHIKRIRAAAATLAKVRDGELVPKASNAVHDTTGMYDD